MLKVGLDLSIVEFASNETFRIEDAGDQGNEMRISKNRSVDLRIMRVHSDLILCGITDKALAVREGDIRRSCSVSLVVCNDFYTIVLPHTDAAEKKEGYKFKERMKRVEMLTSRLCQDQYR